MTREFAIEIDTMGFIGTYETETTPQECSSDYGDGTATERWDETEIVSVRVETIQTENGEFDRDPSREVDFMIADKNILAMAEAELVTL